MGAYNRYRNGLWNHLKTVYIFDRQIAYDRFDEDEMKFKCGCLVTAWFHWDMKYEGKPSIEILDIQKRWQDRFHPFRVECELPTKY